jgi:transposase-like protein
MNMAYTTNEKVGKVRIQAIRMVSDGKSTREVARHFGYNQSTIVRWYKRKDEAWHRKELPTRSSRPHVSPRRTPRALEGIIIAKRNETGLCAKKIHWKLLKEGLTVPTIYSANKPVRDTSVP